MISLTTDDLKKLSQMARVPLPENVDEIKKIADKFQAVLDFVAQVESVVVPDSVPHYFSPVNITRNDFLFTTDPDLLTSSDIATLESDYKQVRENILNEFPSRQGDHLVVPLVLKKAHKKNN